jgi:hypothetical protein
MGYVQSGIRISGLNDAVAGLKAMGAESELRALNLEVGNIVRDEAKTLVPVRTTALQGSIKTVRSLLGVTVQAGKDPLIPYANPINWGWFYDRENFIAKNIKPTQFMNKAVKNVRPRIIDMYMSGLIKIYEQYAGSTYQSHGPKGPGDNSYDYTIGSYK